MNRFIATIMILFSACPLFAGSQSIVPNFSAVVMNSGQTSVTRWYNFVPFYRVLTEGDITAYVFFDYVLPESNSSRTLTLTPTTVRFSTKILFYRNGYKPIVKTLPAAVISGWRNFGISGSEYFFNSTMSVTITFPADSEWIAEPVVPPDPPEPPDGAFNTSSMRVFIGLQSFFAAVLLGFVFVYGLKLK